MRHSLALSLAFLATAAPLLAAPASVSASTDAPALTRLPAAVDARAVTLLNRSMEAYAALPALSQTFEFSQQDRSGTQAGEGTWIWQRPGMARVTQNVGGEERRVMSDGNTLGAQMVSTYHQIEPVGEQAIGRVTESLPTNVSVLMGMMLRGVNPFALEIGSPWQSAELLPATQGYGIVLRERADSNGDGEVTRVFFDARTQLITRAQSEVTAKSETGEPMKLVGKIAFAPASTRITPAIFAFTPAKGSRASRQPFGAEIVVGATPPPLIGKTLAGQNISLDEMKGKVVLLDFWATWCESCVAELPTIEKIYDKYREQGFEVVGISSDDDETKLREFVKERDLSWPQVWDQKELRGPNQTAYGVRGIPQTLLIGKDGKIAASNLRDWQLSLAVSQAMAK